MTAKELREAKDELIKMSNNDEQRALYEMRAKILKDKVSALNKAKEEGREEGREEGERVKALDVARNLLDIGMDIEQIMKVTKLSKEEILSDNTL